MGAGLTGQRPERVLLVGAGIHANTVLLPSCQYLGLRVVGVVDPDIEAARSTAAKIGAAADTALDAGLAREVDMVVAAAPMDTHGAIARTAIAAGVPVYCEKPGGADSADLELTAEAARQSGVPVQIGLMRRHAPVFRAARYMVRRERHLSVQLTLSAGPTTDRKGFARDVGIHLADLAGFILGDVRVLGLADTASGGRGSWQCLVEGERGIGTIGLSDMGSWGASTERLWISAPDLTVRVEDFHTLTVDRTGRGSPDDDLPRNMVDHASRVWRPGFTSPRLLNHTIYLQGYVNALDSFANAVAFGTPPKPGLDEAVAAMRLIEEATAELQ